MRAPHLKVRWDAARKRYRVRARVEGHEINRNVPAHILAHFDRIPGRDAERAAAAWAAKESEKLAKRGARKSGEMTLDAIFELYRKRNPNEVSAATMTRDEQMVANLARIIKLPPSQIDLSEASRYRNERAKERIHGQPVSPRTIRNELQCLKKLLDFARKARRETGVAEIALEELPTIVQPAAKGIALTKKEALAVLAADVDHDAARFRRIVLVALTTGLRATPLLELRHEWINRERKWLEVPAEKMKGRIKRALSVPLAEVTLRAIGAGSGLVFPNRSGERSNIKNGFRGTIASLARRKVCRYFTLHDLRRTFASWLEDAGVSEIVIAELMGHAIHYSISTGDHRRATTAQTREYVRIERERRLREAIAVIDGIFAGVEISGETRRGRRKARKKAADATVR